MAGTGATPPGAVSWSHREWLVLGVFGLGLLVGIILSLLPVAPFTRVWSGVPYKSSLGLLLAVVAGGVMGLGLQRWWDNRPGGKAARGRPPPGVDSSRVSSSSSFEIYTPDTALPRKGPRR